MNWWLIGLLVVVIAAYVLIALAADKKSDKPRIKRDYRDTKVLKEAAKCIADGSVNVGKGIWILGGFLCMTIYDGWKTVFKKKTGKTKQGKLIW